MSLAVAAPQALARPPAAEPGAAAAGNQEHGDEWLIERISALIAEHEVLAQARVGIHIQEVHSGRVLYQHNADARYNVASNAKVITAAAALAALGPGFRFRTSVLAEAVDPAGVVAGSLYLRGRGDPSLTSAHLARLADDVVHAGVKEVRGDLVIDDTYFDADVLPPHFDEQPGEQAAFRPPVSALSINHNAFAVVVRPALSGQGRATVAIDPPGDYIRVVKNELVTQTSGRNRILLDSRAVNGGMEVELRGQIRADTPLSRFTRRVDDPAMYAGEVFRALLRARGVRVKGRAARAATPATARALASVDSEPLSVLIHGLGKTSNNFMAEALLKTLGAESLPPGAAEPVTWAHGVNAVRRFLVDDIGLREGSFRMSNGSGLFDATELSPAQLVRVLVAARRDPRYGEDLSASLAIAGVDGTLRRRMQDTLARGRVRAKTGTLARVSSLCGYAAISALEPVAFAVAVNDIPASARARAAARSLQDRVADALVTYLENRR